ncbi:MAG: hypothetical protein DRR19_30735 [Candidatus Parabeggiatoa sp. nov. 1]|nr:MAG: hypothetical protein DRR19_30735 [Gammaproteobacteria bacterium]
MQQFILKLDDPMLETALSSIAQEDGKEITDVIMNAITYFVTHKFSHVKKLASSFSEKTAMTQENSLAYQMSLMASDPQIQSELEQIEKEFSMMDSEGLERI